MPGVNLERYNIRLFECTLTMQDFLWFASYDISSVAATEAVIHNYALSYAVSRFDRGKLPEEPSYEKDLEQMDFYALPASAIDYEKVIQTYNAMDTKTIRTDEYNSKKNTPRLGRKIVLTPLSKFRFYLFSWGNVPTRLIRIGKKRSLARIDWKEIKSPIAVFEEKSIYLRHLINPLDAVGDFESYRIIRIPPFIILDSVKIKNDWFIKDGHNIVHVPKRIMQRVGEEVENR